ncbi:MAG: hypothetical protein IKV32_00365 [Muribaculaceae bacterium]|nr:hypothetical protein [Muribaculaceae bacterium]
MCEIVENNENKESKATPKGNILGILGLIIGILAWVVLYRMQLGGTCLAVVGIVLSIIGLRGRFHNMSMFGLLLSGILLLVVGIMRVAFYYVFNSI